MRITHLLNTWMPTDNDSLIQLARNSIRSLKTAVEHAGHSYQLLIMDGAYDGAVVGTRLPRQSSCILFQKITDGLGIEEGIHIVEPRYGEGWPTEAAKLTEGFRHASTLGDVVIRLDPDEFVDGDITEELTAVGGEYDAAMIEWQTIGKNISGSQNVGSSVYPRILKSNTTLTVGGLFHGSIRCVTRGEWRSIRTMAYRSEGGVMILENQGMPNARIFQRPVNMPRFVNKPSVQPAEILDAKKRLLAYRYKACGSDI